MPLIVDIMTANVFLLLHLVFFHLSFSWVQLLGLFPFFVILPASFWILCLEVCFMLWSPRPWDYSCRSVTPWCIMWAEGVLSCIFFFLVEVIRLLWGLWHIQCCWVFKSHLLVLSGDQAVTSLHLLLFAWPWVRQEKQNVQCVNRKFIPYLTALLYWWLPRIWLA